MVNGGVLEVAGGGSGFRGALLCLCDPQGLLAPKWLLGGCISPLVHATNRWGWTEGVGEVRGLVPRALPSWLRRRRVVEQARIASDSLSRLASLLRVGRRHLRPVLKHGPRS